MPAQHSAKLVCRYTLLLLGLGLLSACQKPPTADQPLTANTSAQEADKASAPIPKVGAQFSMKIDGVPWAADREIWGTVNPTGVDQGTMMSGSFGPKDRNEQTVNINLYDANATGSYRIVRPSDGQNVMQIANLSEQRYLIGGLMFEQDIRIELLERQTSPEKIRATFSGTLQASDGSTVKITDGVFQYP